MPFDGKDFPLVAVPTVKPFDFETATPDERLLELARLLENEPEWREKKLHWDFGEVTAHFAAPPITPAQWERIRQLAHTEAPQVFAEEARAVIAGRS